MADESHSGQASYGRLLRACSRDRLNENPTLITTAKLNM